MTLKVKGVTPKCFVACISKTAGDSNFAAMEYYRIRGMAIQMSKVKVVTPLCLMPIISKTVGDTDLVAMEYLWVKCPNVSSFTIKWFNVNIFKCKCIASECILKDR